MHQRLYITTIEPEFPINTNKKDKINIFGKEFLIKHSESYFQLYYIHRDFNVRSIYLYDNFIDTVEKICRKDNQKQILDLICTADMNEQILKNYNLRKREFWHYFFTIKNELEKQLKYKEVTEEYPFDKNFIKRGIKNSREFYFEVTNYLSEGLSQLNISYYKHFLNILVTKTEIKIAEDESADKGYEQLIFHDRKKPFY